MMSLSVNKGSLKLWNSNSESIQFYFQIKTYFLRKKYFKSQAIKKVFETIPNLILYKWENSFATLMARLYGNTYGFIDSSTTHN